jgi:hypothetical protein
MAGVTRRSDHRPFPGNRRQPTQAEGGVVEAGVGVMIGAGIGAPGAGAAIGAVIVGAAGAGVPAFPLDGEGRLQAASIPAQTSAARALEKRVFIFGNRAKAGALASGKRPIST